MSNLCYDWPPLICNMRQPQSINHAYTCCLRVCSRTNVCSRTGFATTCAELFCPCPPKFLNATLADISFISVCVRRTCSHDDGSVTTWRMRGDQVESIPLFQLKLVFLTVKLKRIGCKEVSAFSEVEALPDLEYAKVARETWSGSVESHFAQRCYSSSA